MDVSCYDSRMRGLADIHLDVRGGDIIVDLPGTRYTVTVTSPSSLLSFSPPTHLVKTILAPNLRKRSSSQERGAWQTKRLVNWIGSFRTEANDLRSRLRRSAVVRTFGDLVDQPSPNSREHMVLATARTKDRRLRSGKFFVVGSVYFNAG